MYHSHLIPFLLLYAIPLFLCGILIVICFIVLIVTGCIFIFSVLKDIEKKYNTKLNIHPSLKRIPAGKLAIARYIIYMYLNEKKIFKNSRFIRKENPLLEINYKVLEEKKFNLYICFAASIAPFLGLAFGGLVILITKIFEMNRDYFY